MHDSTFVGDIQPYPMVLTLYGQAMSIRMHKGISVDTPNFSSTHVCKSASWCVTLSTRESGAHARGPLKAHVHTRAKSDRKGVGTHCYEREVIMLKEVPFRLQVHVDERTGKKVHRYLTCL